MSDFDLQHPTPELLLHAYAQGFFPMGNPDDELIDWYCPDPRAIIPLDGFHVPKSLARVVRAGRFEIRWDESFPEVIEACAPGRTPMNGQWITPRLRQPYIELWKHGRAHSVEAWRDGELVGGLYGVHLGAAFFGESMFSRPEIGGRDASKVCLVHLVLRLLAGGFTLLDTQFANAHLSRFGAIEIPRQAYLARLARAVRREATWSTVRVPARDHRADPSNVHRH